jgi:hypothetical protein
MKKIVFFILFAINVAFLTPGCTGSSGSTSSSTPTPSSASKENAKESSKDESISFAVTTVHLQGIAPTSASVSVTVGDKAVQIQADGHWEIDIPAPTSASIVLIRCDGPGLPSTEEFVMIDP